MKFFAKSKLLICSFNLPIVWFYWFSILKLKFWFAQIFSRLLKARGKVLTYAEPFETEIPICTNGFEIRILNFELRIWLVQIFFERNMLVCTIYFADKKLWFCKLLEERKSYKTTFWEMKVDFLRSRNFDLFPIFHQLQFV